jgi:hypothetical protein
MATSTTTAAIVDVATAVAQNSPKVHKHSRAVRLAKAAASARHRARAKAIANGEQVPAEAAKRQGFQGGNRSIDTEGFTPAQLAQLDRHRAGKREATNRFKERAKLLKEGVTVDQLPAHLQPKAVVKIDMNAAVTFEDLKKERELKRGGQQIFVRMVSRGVAGYKLEKYTKEGKNKTIISTVNLKRDELPATNKAFIKLVDKKEKPAVEVVAEAVAA